MIKSHADTGMPCAGIDGNLFQKGINWIAFEGDTPSDATISRPSNLPTPNFNHFSNIRGALEAHMHSKHTLSHANSLLVISQGIAFHSLQKF